MTVPLIHLPSLRGRAPMRWRAAVISDLERRRARPVQVLPHMGKADDRVRLASTEAIGRLIFPVFYHDLPPDNIVKQPASAVASKRSRLGRRNAARFLGGL